MYSIFLWKYNQIQQECFWYLHVLPPSGRQVALLYSAEPLELPHIILFLLYIIMVSYSQLPYSGINSELFFPISS